MARSGSGGGGLCAGPQLGVAIVAGATAVLLLVSSMHLHSDEDFGSLKHEVAVLKRELALVREDVKVLRGGSQGQFAKALAATPQVSSIASPPSHRGAAPRVPETAKSPDIVPSAHESSAEVMADIGDGPVKDCYIFTLWDYPNGAPAFATTNLEAWDLHARGLCQGGLVLLNDSNIPRWIPDMPEEYYRLEYRAAQSDAVRYSAIYHNGGMYIDADFIVTQDLADIITRVDSYDLISYTTGGQNCKPTGTFSSNFMAGKRGSSLHKAVWDAQKAAMTNHCRRDEMKLEKVCCLDDKHVKCHIPWTQLGEGISHRVLGQLFKSKANRDSLKVFCFGGDESLAPADIETVMSKKPQLDQALEHFKMKKVNNPLGRIAYHLYSSSATMSGSSLRSLQRSQLFDERLFLGKLYTMSFKNVGPGPMSQQLFDAEGPRPNNLAGRALLAMKSTIPPAECGTDVGPGVRRPLLCAGPFAAATEELSYGGATLPLLSSQLSARGLSGAVVKIDASSQEWEALQKLPDELLQKIDVLVLSAYFCEGLPSGRERFSAADQRVATLERLSKLFGVVDAVGSSGERLNSRPDSSFCDLSTPRLRQAKFDDSAIVSYVNLPRLEAWRMQQFEYADRLERASRPSATSEDCDGFDSGASDGAGALYVWCQSVLSKALHRKQDDDLLGISYGIATWDKWSRRLSDVHGVRTALYDCYATAANSGKTPSLDGYTVPFDRRDICIAERRFERDGRRFEPISAQMASRGPRGTLVKVDVEGDEWAALEAVSDEDFRKMDLLDVQFYICKPPWDVGVWRERVKVVERLARFFAVAARTPEAAMEFRSRPDEDFCRDFPTFSVSYVSKERLKESHGPDR